MADILRTVVGVVTFAVVVPAHLVLLTGVRAAGRGDLCTCVVTEWAALCNTNTSSSETESRGHFSKHFTTIVTVYHMTYMLLRDIRCIPSLI